MVKQKVWVIYVLKCPLSNKIRYVGKSNNYKTRYKQHCKDFGTETYKKLWIKKLKNKGFVPILEILETSTNDIEARIKENDNTITHLNTVYNIFMPGKKQPTCSDYRKANKINFDCEFELKSFDTDKYNKL